MNELIKKLFTEVPVASSDSVSLRSVADIESDNLMSSNEILLTFDTDWCPDYVIEYVLHELEKCGVKSTWFVTHQSPIIEKMRKNKLIELGIHPNFHPDSTQGKDIDEIMNHMLEIVPDAVSARTHTLFWTGRLLNEFKKYGIRYDSSLLLYRSDNIEPHRYNSTNLTRFPIFWEDDIALMEGYDIMPDLRSKGLKILNFHPIHIFLNSCNLDNYNKGKKDGDWRSHVNPYSAGLDVVFRTVIETMSVGKTLTLKELGKKYN